jgi:hypothetical protein
MHADAIAIEPFQPRQVLFTVGRRAVRSTPLAKKQPLERGASGGAATRTRVAIRVWQTHSWTIKIVVGKVRPAMAAKARIVRHKSRT